MKKTVSSIVTFLLIVGITVKIIGDDIVVSYKRGSVTKRSTVSRYHSTCLPEVGQKVFFYKGYKVVECVSQTK